MAEESAADRIKMSIGNAIKDKLTETIKNADVLSMLQKIVAMTTEDEQSEEVRGKLEGVLAQYDAMPENEKLQFVAQLKEALATRLSMKLQDQDIDFSGVQEAIGYAVISKLAMVAGAVILFIIVLDTICMRPVTEHLALITGEVKSILDHAVQQFVFFGYKLYKSITDKEKKREEKKKAKQMKKKK